MFKKWFLSLILVAATFTGLQAQTVIIDPAGAGGFELGPSFLANGWTVVNDNPVTPTNQWYVGSLSVGANFSGNKAYISNDGGVSYAYTNNADSRVAFYRDVTFPAGETVITLSFTLRVAGEASYDALQVAYAPVSSTITSSNSTGGGTFASILPLYTGAVVIGTTPGYVNIGGLTGITVTISVPPSVAGTTQRLIFTWRNDTSAGTTPGAAIDNISLTSAVPQNYTASAGGGLWSSPATWVGNVVPPSANNVSIPAGSVVTIDQAVTTGTLSIDGTLQWNATANALTTVGDITVGATGKLHAYTSANAAVSIITGGSFINNGFVNLARAVLRFEGSTLSGNTSQSLTGSGTFAGKGSSGIINALLFLTNGNSTISTTSNLITTNFGHSAGTLNTNGKLSIDNTADLYGETLNRQVANVVVTGLGTGYTTEPKVFGSTVLPYTSGGAVVSGSRYFNGNNVYLALNAVSFNATPPTFTTPATVDASSGPQLLYLGTLGQLGNHYFVGTLVLGTQYFYNGNLYTCITGGTSTATGAPVHTSGSATVGGTAVLQYVGTVARATVNWDNGTSTVRSLNLTDQGLGYYTAAPTVVISPNVVGVGSGATATAVLIQSIPGTTVGISQRNGTATITGGINIKSDQSVGGITTTAGGVNYSAAPQVGFSLPTGFLNLVTDGGAGYTANPTVALSGGTRLTGGTDPTFTVVTAGGKVVSVICTGGGTLWTSPPTLTLNGGGFTTQATAAFPANCLATATANLTNGTITSFTITNGGFGYVAAPTVGLVTAPATVSTAATAPTCRAGIYDVRYANFIPGTPGNFTAGPEIPTNGRINSINHINTGFTTTVSGNLEIYGSTPLTTTNGANTGIIDLGSNTLNFSHPSYAGVAGSTTFSIRSKIRLNSPGGSLTRTFPFNPTLVSVAGTGSLATGSTVTQLDAEITGPPSNDGTMGTRAYRLNTNGGTFGVNPTVQLNWDAADALTGNLQNLYISQATSLTGPWTPRSAATGTGAIGATGSRTTATTGLGPIQPTGNDFFAWTNVVIDSANVTVPVLTCIASDHLISGDFTTTLGTISSVVINYNNGAPSGPIAMTNTSGNTWQYTIPAASPANTVVTWSITVTNSGGISRTFTGTSYQDEPLTGATLSINAVPNPVCSLSPVVLTANATGLGLTTLTSYVWNDGTNDVGFTNPYTANPASSTTYTVTASNAQGCSLASSPATVNTITLPSGVTSVSEIPQCGQGVPTSFVTGSTNGNYRWYLVPTGGTALANEFNSALQNYSISTTTTFYVSITDGTCESLRSAVVATVNDPDAVEAQVSDNNPCRNSEITLSAVQTGNTQNYTYTWSVNNYSGSGLTEPVQGASINVIPTAVGTYIYTVNAVDGDCATSSQVSITVKALPSISAATANPATVCAGEDVTLASKSGNLQSLTYTSGTGVLVNLATSTTATGYPAPFGNYYQGALHQILFRASELTAAGLAAGTINSIAFDVLTPSTTTLTGFNIGIKQTNLTALTSTLETGFTTVYGPLNYTPSGTAGYATNTINLSVPFEWDGVSNIIIQTCFANGTFSTNAVFRQTATAYVSTTVYRADLTTVCSSPALNSTFQYSQRPNIRLSGNFFITGPSLNWSWNNGGGTQNGVTSTSVVVNPLTTTTYTVTATDPVTTCSNTSSIEVNVNPVPTAPDGIDSEQCGSGVPTASVSTSSGTETPTFKWYLVPTGGTAVQTGTSNTYETSISTTTVFYVSEISAFGCEGPRTAVTVTVNPPDAITATSTSVTICLGQSFTLDVDKEDGVNTYDYSWTASPEAGSGIINPASGQSQLVEPTAAGTYLYTVNALDEFAGCSATSSISVTVNSLPAGVTAGASSLNVCTGSTVNLTSGGTPPAVLINEGFEVVVPLPTGWAQQNLSSPIGTVPTWVQGNVSIFNAQSGSATSFIQGNFNNVAGAGNISNWLFTPTVTLKNGQVLKFWSRTVSAPQFADRLQVRLSTNGASVNAGATSTSVGDYTTLLLDINPTLTALGYPNNWTEYTITISGLAGPTSGRIAFRYFVTDGGPSGSNSDNIGIDNVTLTDVSEALTFSWTSDPAGFTSNQQNPQNVVVNQTTEYIVTALNAAGCTAEASVTVTAIPLPNAPIGVSSTQCGLGTPTASVSTGGANGTFRWYSAETGGTLLQLGGTTYLNQINTTTTFWVSESDGTCESLRTPVTVTVTQPDPIQASAVNATICLTNDVELSVANTAETPSNTYTYTWTALPAAGSGIPVSVPGASVTVTPTAAGTYQYTVTGVDNSGPDVCTITSTISVLVNPNPTVPVATATPGSVCLGASSQLDGTILGAQNNLVSTLVSGNGNAGNMFDITATNTITINSFEMGITSGTLAEVYYKAGGYGCVASVTGTPASNGWTLVGQVAITPAGASPNLTNIPLPVNITIPAGQTYGFVVVCNGANYYSNGVTLCAPLSSDANIVIKEGIGGSGGFGGSFTFTNSVRNFNGRVNYTAAAQNVTYQWTPATGLNNANIANPLATPTATTNYTVKVTNTLTGCFSTSDPVTVSVLPVAANATANPATPVCAGATVVVSANATGGSPFSYAWSDGGPTVYPDAASITVNPTVTTTYTVIVTDACSNVAQSSSVTVTVNPLPTASIAEEGPITLCSPLTQTLTAVSNAASPSYQWRLNGNNINLATSSTYVVSGVGSGSYSVVVTDGETGCSQTSGSITVTINPSPTGVTATASTLNVCEGSSLNLTASADVPSPSVLSQNFESGLGLWSVVNTTTGGSNPALAIWALQANGYSYSTDVFTGNQGTSFLMANSDAAGSGNNANTTVTSPAFNTNGYSTLSLTFKHYYRHLTAAAAFVEVSTNGTTWTQVASYSATTGTAAAFAQAPAINLNAYVNNANLQVRFRYQTTGWWWYWAIDDIQVTGTSAPYSYAWTSTPAGFTSNVQNPTNVTPPGVGTYTYQVTATNSFGCSDNDNASTLQVVVNPRATGVISGDAIYPVQTSTPLSIAVTGTGPWSGTLAPGNIPFSGSSSPITVNVSPAFTTTYTIATLVDEGVQSGGCASIAGDLTGSATITVVNLAAPTFSVIQPTCAVATGTITVTAPLTSGFEYSIDGNNYQPSNVFSGVAPGTYSVTFKDLNNFISPAASATVNPQPFIPAAPTMTGIVNVCPFVGTGTELTYTASAAGATSYTWTLPPLVTLVSSTSGNASITVRFETGFIAQVNKQLRVRANSICGTSPIGIYYLQAQYPNTPAPISGPTNVCPFLGVGSATYSVPEALGAASYIWTAQAGVVITPAGPGPLGNTVSVEFPVGFTTSAITVQAVNECGVSGIRSITVTRATPSTPSPISGPTNVCEFIAPNGTAATYSVPLQPGVDTYTWTLPGGATSITGQGTNTISFIYPSGYTGGSISVVATNGCGTSVTPRTLAVSRLNPATPSVIDVIQTGNCPERVYTYTLAALPANATSILWTIPVEGTLVSGQGTTSISVSYPATAVSGTVTATAVNNCGTSVTRSVSVKLAACPPPPEFSKGTTVTPVPTMQVDVMDVKVFPNPSVSDFKLQVQSASKELIHVRILDMTGREYKLLQMMAGETLSLGGTLKPGSYLIEVRQGKQLKTTKVLKF